MGTLSDRLHKGGGPRPRSNGSKSGPLRKIVGTCRVGYVRMECYECGHIALPKSDLMGQTNAVRRRCRKCKNGWPVHFTGDPPSEMSAAEYDRLNGPPKPPSAE